MKKGLYGDLLLENKILRFEGIKGRDPGYYSVIAIFRCFFGTGFFVSSLFYKRLQNTQNPMKYN